MAAALQNNSDDDIISDINVTPLVDIILVLLIIFMVTASVIVTPAIKVDLPKAANADDNPESTVSLILTRDRRLFLNGKPTTWLGMADSVARRQIKHPDLQAVISADKKVAHGDVIHLIDTIKGLGIVKFALNIERVSYKTEARDQ
jgi:biopolymer transport protein ExbD